jgi:hypothetical protein
MTTTFNNAIDTAIANAPANAVDNVLTPEQAVDRLAYIKSAIAALKEEETACKDILITHGMRAYESSFYRATVAEVAGGTKTDWQALAMSMKPSKQKIVAYTSPTAGYFRIDVRAKKTS